MSPQSVLRLQQAAGQAIPPEARRRTRTRPAICATTALLALLASTAAPLPAAASAAPLPGHSHAQVSRPTIDQVTRVQQAVEQGPVDAAANDVEQSVAVVDRITGELIASHNGDQVYNTESILKLFTAAYYLVQVDGQPDQQLRSLLTAMIAESDDSVQTELWNYDIVPTIAERYGLTNTRNGPSASPQSWGSDRTTTDDQALFLYRMSVDPMVGPLVMTWMASTAATGADGFDQSFGLASLTGDHGSKQGWSDPGWSPANLHSVGWTEHYFVAILQTSPTATYATMRATSTSTARSVDAAAETADDQLGDTVAASKHRARVFGRVIATAFQTAGIDRSIGIGWIALPDDAAKEC